MSAKDLAALCKAAADPLRLNILRVLRHESYGVQDLAYIFDTIQSGMSHHLKLLARAALLTTRKEGTRNFYRRALIQEDDPHLDLRRGLFKAVDQLQLDPEILERQESIQEERNASSRVFFARNAERFREKQDLIVTYPQYEGCINDLLSALALPTNAEALEVGPGTGELLANLANRFARVTALDNASEMLATTRRAMERLKFQNITYTEGTPETLVDEGVSLDLVVLNMVLHHMASPAQSFRHCAQLLKAGGALLIADLNSHGQEWVREMCGDLWLGFEPDDLDNWARAAGLQLGQSIYLTLNNGFQVQVRLFKAI